MKFLPSSFIMVLLFALTDSTLVSAQAPDLYDLPTVRTFHLTFHQTNYWSLLTTNYASKTYIKADLTVDNVIYKDVGVRFRGNSSFKAIPASSQKKPFKISMDEYVPGQDLYGFNTINLNNGFRDPTFTREVVTCTFNRRFHPCPRANYAKLTINNQNWGVYINIQQINNDLMEEYCKNLDGNRYRGERSGIGMGTPNLAYLGSSAVNYRSSYQLKNENALNPWTDLINLCNVLNNTPVANLQVQLPKALDVDCALRYLVGINIVPAIDSYIWNIPHNFYLFNDLHHNRFLILPWDLNAAFGGVNVFTVAFKKTLNPFYKNNSTRPLLYKLLGQTSWKERYLAYFRSMLNYGFDWKSIGTLVKQCQTLVQNDFKNDPKKLYTLTQFTDNVTKDVSLFISNRWQIIPGLKPFVEGRRNYLLAHQDINRPVTTLSELTHSPTQPTNQDKIWFRVKVTGTQKAGAVTLHWRIVGSYTRLPMHDDGLHNDGIAGDGIFGGAIPPQAPLVEVEYFITATATPSGAMTVLPPTGGYAPPRFRVALAPTPGGIKIAEFMAKNKNGIKDEMGEREDWVELVNLGPLAADLAGYHLTDNYANLTKWKFPANQILQPGASLIVWLDDEPADGPLHATFKLDGSGEEIALIAKDGTTPLDAITFGPQESDISLGRIHGYHQYLVTFPQATPNASNLPFPGGHLPFQGLDAKTNPLTLSSFGLARIGTKYNYDLSLAPLNSPAMVALSSNPYCLPLPPLGTLLVNPAGLWFYGATTNSVGQATIPFSLPNNPVLINGVLSFQGFSYSLTGGGFTNGLRTKICQ